MVEKRVNGRVVRVERGDITLLEIDAFVLQARRDRTLGTGFGGAVAARGGPSIQEELKKLPGPVEVGGVAITGAGNLKAKHIIHAAAPGFQEEDEEGKLRTTTLAALRCADEHDIRRLAFPALGAGFHGIALDVCARVMVDAVREHLGGETGLAEVVFCANDAREYGPFAARLQAMDAGGGR